ncbi:MAG: AAA family ATPase [Planctomycetota bacterium]|nr:AAA family ATPase [Planctomycetota bacterium]
MNSKNMTAKRLESKDPWQELPFDPWLIVPTIRRSWWWAVPLGLIISGLVSGFIYWSFVPEYSASHLLEANRDFVVFQGVMQGHSELLQNERPLIENHLVLSPVLSDPKICEAPSLRDIHSREINIRRNLSLSDAGSKTLLRVSYRDTEPVAAASVCNAIVRSYLQQRQRFDDRRISDLEGWLQPALKLWQDEVEQHRERIVSLSKQAKGFDPFQETTRLNTDSTYLTSLRDELSLLRSNEAVIEAELLMLKDALSKPGQNEVNDIDPMIFEALVKEQEEVASASRLLDEKNEEMRMMEKSDLVRTRQAWYDNLKKDIAALENQLSSAKLAVRPMVLSKWRESAVVAKTAELTRTRTRRNVIESNFKAEEERLSKFAGETAELYFAQQKYLQARNILERLNERTASLRTERQKSSTIQTLAEAQTPTAPIESVPWKKILMFAVASFTIPFGLAFLLEIQSKRISHSDSLEGEKEIPVLGEVVMLPSHTGSSKKQRAYDESIDSLRANFILSDPGNTQTLVIASSMPGEGKSTLATHLAISLSKMGDGRVLLMDADFRSPDQHHLFGLPMSEGLAGVLRGSVTLDEATDTSFGEQLHILTAGEIRRDLARIVSKERIEKLMQEVKGKYRFIIIDTAPVLAASETLSFAAGADGTLLCTMRDVTRQDHLQRCMRRLDLSGAKLIGTVFSGMPIRQYIYRYGDYRYSMPLDAESSSTDLRQS